MKPKTIMLLKTVARYLLQALEILNLVDEEDYLILVRKCQSKSQIKAIFDNARRGSLWLVVFFTLEMLDDVIDEVSGQELPTD